MKTKKLFICFLIMCTACSGTKPTLPMQITIANTSTSNPKIEETPIPRKDTPVTPTDPPIEEPDIAATLSSTVPFSVYQKYLSPDGGLEIRIYTIGCTNINEMGEVSLEQMAMINLKTKLETISYTQLINCGGLGTFGLEGLFWSENSRYFYFTNAREGSPDGCCQFYYSKPLFRLSVENGEVTAMGMGERSPDKQSLVTRVYEEFVIWDIKQGTEIHFSRLDDKLGIASMAWSPDSKFLAYLQVNSLFMLKSSKLVILNLTSGEQTEIVFADFHGFIDLEWQEIDELFLITADAQNWIYKLSTDSLKQVK